MELHYKNGKNIITLESKELKESAQRDLTQYALLEQQYQELHKRIDDKILSENSKRFYETQIKNLDFRLKSYRGYIKKSYGFFPLDIDGIADVSKYVFNTRDDYAEKLAKSEYGQCLQSLESEIAEMEKDISQETSTWDSFIPAEDENERIAEEKDNNLNTIDVDKQKSWKESGTHIPEIKDESTFSLVNQITNTTIEQYDETLNAASQAEKAYLFAGSQYKTAITKAYEYGNASISKGIDDLYSAQEDLLDICKSYSETYKKSGERFKEIFKKAKENCDKFVHNMYYVKDCCLDVATMGVITELRRNQMYQVITGYAEAIEDYNNMYAQMALAMREKMRNPGNKEILKAYNKSKKLYDFSKKMRTKYEKKLQATYMMGCTTKEEVDNYIDGFQKEIWGESYDGKIYESPAQEAIRKTSDLVNNITTNMKIATLGTRVATYDFQIDVAMDITGNVDRALDKIEEKIDLLQNAESEYQEIKEKLEECAKELASFIPYVAKEFEPDEKTMRHIQKLQSLKNPTRKQKNELKSLLGSLENEEYWFNRKERSLVNESEIEKEILMDEYYDLSKKWAIMKEKLENVNNKYLDIEERLSEIPEYEEKE